MTTTFEHLRTILTKDYKLNLNLLTMDAPLEALGIDSLGIAELLFNVEDEFHITLSPDSVQLVTLGDMVRFIDELILAQHGSAAHPDAAVAPGLRVT